MYQHAIIMFIAATGWTIDAKTVTVDYEQALLKTTSTQFRGAKIIGCLFHWKQAIRRKLISHHIPEQTVSKFVGKRGPLELLCVIPINEIMVKGISYVRKITDEGAYIDKFNTFWNYFQKTWMSTYHPNTWNIHDILSNEDDNMLINRTNNACESFNRRLLNIYRLRQPHDNNRKFKKKNIQ